jgi:hypothetical protein
VETDGGSAEFQPRSTSLLDISLLIEQQDTVQREDGEYMASLVACACRAGCPLCTRWPIRTSGSTGAVALSDLQDQRPQNFL